MSEPYRREAIVGRLDALRRAVARSRTHQETTLPAFLANDDEQWVVERGLQLAAALRLPPPENYTQAVDRMADAGILPRPFAAEFRKIGGFRNVLTHGYLDIDPRIVHGVLVEQLAEYEVFARHIAAFLDRGRPGNR